MPWIEFACPEADRRNWFGVDLPVINDSAVDGAELDAAIAHVHSELDAIQHKGIAASRIVLGGYGPGAALALLAGRTYGHDLAGIACMGGWLLRPNRPSSSARSPILLGHGEEDDDGVRVAAQATPRRATRGPQGGALPAAAPLRPPARGVAWAPRRLAAPGGAVVVL